MNQRQSPARRAKHRWRRALGLSALLALPALAVAFFGARVLLEYDLYRARRALAEVDLVQALSWLHAAERRAPRRADVQFLLGSLYRRGAMFGPAREHLDLALDCGFSRREVERQEWMLRFQIGEIREIEPLLTKLLERGGSDEMVEDIFESMIMGYQSDRSRHDARAFANYWVQWRPDSLRARLQRLQIYETDLNNASSAEQIQAELREVLRIDPRRVTERLKLAQGLLDEKRVDDALAECEICRRQAPGDPRVSLQLGACHFQLGRLDEAKQELESALSMHLEPTARLEALTELGQVASTLRDFDLSARCCKEALELSPHEPIAAYRLGLALAKLGQDELAQQYLKRSERLSDEQDRMAEIETELATRVGNVELRLEMAQTLLDQGRQADAAAWMQSVLRYDPTCRKAHECLAQFYEEHGKIKLAQTHRDAMVDTAATEGADDAEAAPVTGDQRPL